MTRFIFWLYLLPAGAAFALSYRAAQHDGFGFWAVMAGLYGAAFLVVLALPFVIDRINFR